VALRISPHAGLLIGVMLEPTTIRTVATTLDGKMVASLQLPSSKTFTYALSRLQQAVGTLVQQEAGSSMDQVRGIGVGVPGLMDRDGNLTLAPNLSWENLALRRELEEVFPVPVYVDNDTKAAALAEKLFGACRDQNDFIFITGHSGVGSGLYLGGSLYRGSSGYAGEIGHMKIVPNGRPCGCGKRGCLEAYVSGSAILARLEERGTVLGDIWEVAAQAEAGQPDVLDVLVETGRFLGYAIANLLNVINPRLVVLSGNLAVVAPFILPAVRQAITDHALDATCRTTDILVSPLGTESVPMGGVALAMEGFLSLPSWLAAGTFRTP
jgi:predicted NBD/HSP70 family sugar kinase